MFSCVGLTLSPISLRGACVNGTEFHRALGKCRGGSRNDPGHAHHHPSLLILVVADCRLSAHVLQRVSPPRSGGRDCSGLPALLQVVERGSAASCAHRSGHRLPLDPFTGWRFSWFFGSLKLAQLSDLAAKFPEWLNNLADFVRDRWPKVVEFTQTNPLGQRIRGVLISHQEALFKGFRQWAEQPFQ